jgi:hypothetical protein
MRSSALGGRAGRIFVRFAPHTAGRPTLTTVAPMTSGKTAPFSGAVVALLALAIFINYVDRGNLATAAPLIKGELKLSNTQIGILRRQQQSARLTDVALRAGSPK